MSKKSEKEKFRQAHNHAAMVETMMSVRDMMRDPLPDNPPPDDKWKAAIGLARLNLNGACHRVMVCLIDHANPETGLCFPSEELIAGWTGSQTRVIERAIATLRKKRLLHVVSVPCRTGKRNRYYLNWTPLFAAFKEIKAFEKAHREKRDDPTKVSGSPPNDPTKVSGYDPTKVSAEPLKGEPLKKQNLQHEVVHSPKSERTHHDDEETRKDQKREERLEPTTKEMASKPKPQILEPQRLDNVSQFPNAELPFDWWMPDFLDRKKQREREEAERRARMETA